MTSRGILKTSSQAFPFLCFPSILPCRKLEALQHRQCASCFCRPVSVKHIKLHFQQQRWLSRRALPVFPTRSSSLMKRRLNIYFLWLLSLMLPYLWLFISGSKSSGSQPHRIQLWDNTTSSDKDVGRITEMRTVKPLHHPPLRTPKNVTAAEHMI